MRPPQVTVIIATRNRAEVLKQTLESFLLQDTAAAWELVIVNNGSSDHTATVAASFSDRLPIRLLVEDLPGKSRALNLALESVRGRLFAFTDDDVNVSRSWISELLRAADAYPEASVFCGPIVPIFPLHAPRWLRDQKFASVAFASFSPAISEGLLLPPAVPLGPNFAARADQCTGMRFRVDLGPSAAGSFLCEDTEFVARFRKKGVQFVYLPSAPVEHRIREELLSFACQYDRAFYMGRSLLISGNPILNFGRFAYSPIPEASRFERDMILNFYLGQLCQSHIWQNAVDSDIVLRLIEGVRWDGDLTCLGKSALEFLEANPIHRGATTNP